MISLQQRGVIVSLVNEAVAAGARRSVACRHLGIDVRSLQRWQAIPTSDENRDGRSRRRQEPANALSEAERKTILEVANSAEFGDLPPTQIVPRLADQGRFVGSESTFYRVLRKAGQLAHRRPERRPSTRQRPRALSATGPDQLISWDITYLPTIVLGIYLYLYVFMDVFSRHIVAWQVHTEECQLHASALFLDYVQRSGIPPGQLTSHSDNGAPMKGSTLIATLQKLGVARSLSRPSVSNDNPYSEALFRTLKYRPEHRVTPFADVEQARQFAACLVHWYGHEHRHSAISYVTPAQRHSGADKQLLADRHALYLRAKAANPQRWSGKTRNWSRRTIVHLNPAPALNGNAEKSERSSGAREERARKRPPRAEPHIANDSGNARFDKQRVLEATS